MTIEKSDKVYTVRENKASWTLTITVGRVTLTYNVPKDDCPTFADLSAYIAQNDLF